MNLTHNHYIYYCGQESLTRNGVAITVNKSPSAVLGCSLKNDRLTSVCFQGKPFSITVIQVCAPTSNAEEAEVEWFYEDLQDHLELMLPRQKDDNHIYFKINLRLKIMCLHFPQQEVNGYY